MKKRSLYARILVSAAFLWVVFANVSSEGLANTLRSAEPLYVVLSFLLTPVLIAISCLKWKVLLDSQGEPVPFSFLMRNYMIGYYFSNILPSNVGGDVVRSYYVGRHVGSQSRAAVSVLLERVTGVVLLLALVIAAPLARIGIYAMPHIFVPAAVSGFLLLAGMLMARAGLPSGGMGRKTMAAVSRLRANGAASGIPWLRAVAGWLQRVGESFFLHMSNFRAKLVSAAGNLLTDRKMARKVIYLTLLFYAATWINVYVAFKAFGAEVSLAGILSVVPTIMLVSMIPISLGSVGLAEGAYVFYFGLIGVDAPSALAMALLLRLKGLAAGTVGAAFYLTGKRTDGGPPDSVRAPEGAEDLSQGRG